MFGVRRSKRESHCTYLQNHHPLCKGTKGFDHLEEKPEFIRLELKLLGFKSISHGIDPN